MQDHQPIANPFELMMNPESVLQAMARSDRLDRLQRRICRPLDKPVIARKGSATEAFDDAIEAQIPSETNNEDEGF